MTGPVGTGSPLTYAGAGVDVAAGERVVGLLGESVRRTARPEVLGGIGGFAGLFAPDLTGYRRPVLVSSTDGVGTKSVLARRLGRHRGLGVDLVGMVVDDIVVCGAEPLFLTDYVACGRLVPEVVAELVAGVADGCAAAGCALLGGETAEHPGVLAPDDYDLAGAGVGVVEADALLGPERVRAGDELVALASSGLHANGYSLVRQLLARPGAPALDAAPAALGGRSTLGEALLAPTRIYAPDCLALAGTVPVHAFAHVTGGGIAANLARVVPPGLLAEVDRATWSPPGLFRLLAALGPVAPDEAERTFNQGIGMLAVVAAGAGAAAVAALAQRDVPAFICGRVRTDPGAGPAGRAVLVGAHPG